MTKTPPGQGGAFFFWNLLGSITMSIYINVSSITRGDAVHPHPPRAASDRQ